jgi:phosphomannomutase/phosphoglucomutase
MNKSIAKGDIGAQAAPGAREATPAAARRMPPPRSGRGLRRYGFLIGATLVLLAGAFLIWQLVLILAERDDAARLAQVQDLELRSLGALIATTRERVENAVATDAVTAPLVRSFDEGRDAAAASLKQALPDLIRVDFYRSDIGDVLESDFAKLGYARSSMLVQAVHLHATAPAQSASGEGGRRQLVFAVPLRRDRQIVAFAYLALPFEPVLATFNQPVLGAGRLELRQGNGAGDLVLAAIGSDAIGNSLDNVGMPIANSTLRIGTVAPQPLIFLPRDLGLLIPLVLLVLFIGATMFYARLVGWRRAFERMVGRTRAAPAHGPTLAESLDQLSLQPLENPRPMSSSHSTAAKIPVAGPASIPIERSMFRAYDIRGVLGQTLNADVARLIGRAIGSEAISRGLSGIAVGRDGRLSGPELSAALIEGLRAAGIDVTDIGAAPTPVLYFAAYYLDIGSGVMVTGSHNPPDYNGFKIVLGGQTLSEDAIQTLYRRIVENDFTSGNGSLVMRDLSKDYLERIAGDVQLQRKLKVVVDCGNGIPGAIAPQVLSAIGAEVVPLFCEVDGNFPNHHPDPSDLHNLKDLILSVKQLKADIGLAFDGDGDRLGVVTASGEVIFPDRTLMLFARDVLSRNPGATIIYDVKCTGKLQPLILQAGGSPVMWRTGHSLIKSKMRETDAALAGEMSGHFFFKERWYGFDDGIYAAARLLEILAGDANGRDAQVIFDELPKGVSTPELKIEMAEGEHYQFMDRFKAAAQFDGARLTTLDGVRADWPDGWGLVRPSNTTPVLVLRFDADNATALKRIQDAFRAQLLAQDAHLKLPF